MKNWKQLPFITGAIVAVNLIVFILTNFMHTTLMARGMLDAYEILSKGEYGRIVTAMFLHGSVNHLFGNMMCILFIGSYVEQELGHVGFGVIYLLSGICGNLLSLYFKVISGSMIPSIGASGAAFGLDGALIAIVLFSGRRMNAGVIQRILAGVLLSLYSGYVSSNVDNEAHLGGLAGGFVVGTIVCLIQRSIQNKKRNQYFGR